MLNVFEKLHLVLFPVISLKKDRWALDYQFPVESCGSLDFTFLVKYQVMFLVLTHPFKRAHPNLNESFDREIA